MKRDHKTIVKNLALIVFGVVCGLVLMEIDSEISAPITRGQDLGVVNVKLDDELMLSEKIVAMQDIAEGSLFVRAMDSIKLMFR